MTKVEHIKVFSDFSGAPAVVSSGRYRFAFDTLGCVTCTLIAPVSGSHTESKIAKGKALAAYVGERNQRITEEWLVGNRALYSELAAD